MGDGSVNNAHFLTAVNLAEYAKFRQFRCPVLFGITDNNVCISLDGYGWLQAEWKQKLRLVFLSQMVHGSSGSAMLAHALHIC